VNSKNSSFFTIFQSFQITEISSRLFSFQILQSNGSCAGVIFTAQDQKFKSISTSVTIGISLFVIGTITVFQIKSVYLSSSGFTVIQVSQSIVSGLVVATTIKSLVHLI
jgi:hypothetical protein